MSHADLSNVRMKMFHVTQGCILMDPIIKGALTLKMVAIWINMMSLHFEVR